MYQRTGCDREDKSGPGIASPGKNSDGRHDGAYGCGRNQVAPTVGAERSGRTAVSHRQDRLWIFDLDEEAGSSGNRMATTTVGSCRPTI